MPLEKRAVIDRAHSKANYVGQQALTPGSSRMKTKLLLVEELDGLEDRAAHDLEA